MEKTKKWETNGMKGRGAQGWHTKQYFPTPLNNHFLWGRDSGNGKDAGTGLRFREVGEPWKD